MKYSIYLLSCPATGGPKYIGATRDPDRRYKQHCRLTENHSNTARCNWLRSLLQQGQKPVITILEDDLDCYDRAERKWIKEYSSKYNLVNGNEGGFDVSHTHKSSHSNKSKGSRSKLAIYLSTLKSYTNELEANGEIKADHFRSLYLNLVAICNQKRKDGTYQFFVQLCEERFGK